MGRYSDSDDDRKRKKKKKRRSRSRSPDSDYSYEKKKSKKSKKKSKKRSRSRSRSIDRSRRRSRSLSRGRRSRSHSRNRRRSRSRSRDRRSRSYSRERRSRSRSYERSSKSKRYRSRSRSRSTSRSRRYRRSRSRSRSHSRDRNEDSQSAQSNVGDPCADIAGFKDMTPAEQNKIRLQLALKAAAAADEKLHEQGHLEGKTKALTLTEQLERQQALDAIENPGFEPGMFKSSRGKTSKETTVQMKQSSHENAIFGRNALGDFVLESASNSPKNIDIDTLAHPNLYVSAEEKMERWKKKLMAMRRRKLEGEVMS